MVFLNCELSKTRRNGNPKVGRKPYFRCLRETHYEQWNTSAWRWWCIAASETSKRFASTSNGSKPFELFTQQLCQGQSSKSIRGWYDHVAILIQMGQEAKLTQPNAIPWGAKGLEILMIDFRLLCDAIFNRIHSNSLGGCFWTRAITLPL